MSQWNQILQTARFAPSPHNTQPWRVRIVDDRHAILYMEKARMLPDEDITGHFLIHAMAMFLEALTIATANAGITLRHQIITLRSAEPFIPFANLELTNEAPAPSSFPDALFQKRMTSRRPSNGRIIQPDLVAQLKSFEPAHGQQFATVDDPQTIEAIVQENIRAVFHDLNTPQYHDEIARWFRYSDRQSLSTRDGLDHRCMIVPPIELKLMRSLPQVMRWPLTRGLVRRMYRRQLGPVTRIGIINGPFFEDQAALSAGHFLLRFWLELARHDLMIHPFGNLVTNPQSHAWIKSMTGLNKIWLVFRIGYTDDPPRSHRRSVEELLIHD